MIQVSFLRAAGQLVGFEASGHAGYAEYGSDIVCAAVSVLLQTACEGLEKVAGVRPQIFRDDKRGYLKATLPPALAGEQARDAQVILRTAETGIRSIATQYSDYVRIISRNRR